MQTCLKFFLFDKYTKMKFAQTNPIPTVVKATVNISSTATQATNEVMHKICSTRWYLSQINLVHLLRTTCGALRNSDLCAMTYLPCCWKSKLALAFLCLLFSTTFINKSWEFTLLYLISRDIQRRVECVLCSVELAIQTDKGNTVKDILTGVFQFIFQNSEIIL